MLDRLLGRVVNTGAAPQKKLGGFKKNVRKSDASKEQSFSSDTVSVQQKELADEMLTGLTSVLECGVEKVFNMNRDELSKLRDNAEQIVTKYNHDLDKLDDSDDDEDDKMFKKTEDDTLRDDLHQSQPIKSQKTKLDSHGFRLPPPKSTTIDREIIEDDDELFKWKQGQNKDKNEVASKITKNPDIILKDMTTDQMTSIMASLNLGKDDLTDKKTLKLKASDTGRPIISHANGNDTKVQDESEDEDDDNIF